MSTALLVIGAVILYFFFKILNATDQPQPFSIKCEDSNFMTIVLKHAPLLQKMYIPTRLWGFNGHVQTVIYTILQRNSPSPLGDRIWVNAKDGATVTYELYKPCKVENGEDDITVAIIPGVGSTYKSFYIRTFVHWALQHGLRCAVLNHVGTLFEVPLTTPRAFSCGHTIDYHEMLLDLIQKYPKTKIVCLGFSLGGNLVTKYLGDNYERPSNIIGGISVCQGYNLMENAKLLLQWTNFRRFYSYMMTTNLKHLLTKHRNILLSDEIKARKDLKEREIFASNNLYELDVTYTTKAHNFKTLSDLYEWSSSVNYLKNVKTPMIFINSSDDPIIPTTLLEDVKSFAMKQKRTLYLEVAHGGHLGFYEGGFIIPNYVTWLDKSLVELVNTFRFLEEETFVKI